MTPVATGHTIVVAVFWAEDARGYEKSSRHLSIVPRVAASAGNEKAREPGRFVVVTVTGAAAAVRTAAANLLMDR
jgi:hypothetical protein